MRFRPRFTLRTMLIAVTLFCILSGWLSYQFYWIGQRDEVARRHRAGVSISITELSSMPRGVRALIRDWPVPRKPKGVSAPWPLRWLGENGYAYVLVKRTETQAEFDHTTKLFPEAQVAWMKSQ
jgi:hypothetical protein